MSLTSSRFAAIYDSLPADVQSTIVEKQLIPLLDVVSPGKRRKVIGGALKMQRRHASIPTLDLRGKKREINALLDELHRDAKRSFVKERSHRTELLEQTVESVTSWLNDIWSIVYEHNVDFMLAHKCLLFTMNTLEQIGHGRASCRCAFTNMYIPIVLKRKSGKVVKSWHVNGAHNLEEVLHFIWRDLFLSILANGTQRQKEKIPEMLDDIEDILSWTALERLLHGGRKRPYSLDDDDDDGFDESDTEDDEDYTDEDSELDMPLDRHDWVPGFIHKPLPAHAQHWSHRICSQVWQFRRHVHAAMTAVFKVNPSLRLYSTLLSSTSDPDTTSTELLSFLSQMGTSCSEFFAAALDIYALENKTATIASLLRTHSHLIRPRDAPIFQSAVLVLHSDPFHQSRALEIIEKELLETASAVRSALHGPFSQLESPENKSEMEQILKLRSVAAGRQDRIEHWVDDISSPGTNNPNPMAIAALVMGLPIVPALEGTEDADPLGYLDLDPLDPDMEDLRDEFRPRLKQRFEGWTDTATTVKGGPVILLKVYRELAKTMPFLRASDVVEEMLSRLADKPSKQYLIDAVDALSAFVKVQRRRHAAATKAEKARANAATQTPTPPVAGPSTSTLLTPTTSIPYDNGTPATPAGVPNGSNDRPDTPPPPLEPAAVTPNAAPAPLFMFYTGHIAHPQAGGAGGGVGGFNGMEDVD